MKLIKTISVLAILSAFSMSCAQRAASKSEAAESEASELRKTMTFNETTYESEWESNFDSYDDFKNKWTPMVSWYNRDVNMSRKDAINTITAVDGIAPNLKYGKNDYFKFCMFSKSFMSVEDGVYTQVYSAKREKNNEGGYNYKVNRPWMVSGEYNFGGERMRPFDGYLLKLDGRKKLIEVKFKMTADDYYNNTYNFEFILGNKDYYHDNWDVNSRVVTTSEGWHMDEIDLFELTFGGNANTKEGIIVSNHPAGFTKDGKFAPNTDACGTPLEFDSNLPRVKPDNIEEWFSQWHTAVVELDENGMTLYFDGKKIRDVNWSKKWGSVLPEVEWNIMPFMCPFGTWRSHPLDLDKGETCKLEMDYIRVYSEVK